MRVFIWALVFPILSLYASVASAFVVSTDESVFRLSYANPTETITFDNPTQSSLTGVSYPLVGGNTAFEVREDGWSDAVYVGSLRGGDCCWAATTWYGSDVSPSIYGGPTNSINRIYISVTGPASVISLTTSGGFFGLIPTTMSDTFFALPVGVTLSEMSLGYRELFTVPEPTTAALLGIGLFIGLVRRHGQGSALKK